MIKILRHGLGMSFRQDQVSKAFFLTSIVEPNLSMEKLFMNPSIDC